MNKGVYTLLMLFSVFISSCVQIALKTASKRAYRGKINEYLNSRVIISYSIFILSSFITVYALKYVPLSFAPIIESCGYVFVSLLGRFVLKERLTKKEIIGMLILITGVIIFSL